MTMLASLSGLPTVLFNDPEEYLLAVACLAEGWLIDSFLEAHYDPLLFKSGLGSEAISIHDVGV